MSIKIASTDDELAACYPVMRELRPHIPEDKFLSHVRAQEKAGYRLACVEDADCVSAVAGFRVSENLAWGRFLYVDDLVTLPDHRSNGYGASLLAWLKQYAANEGCAQLHLDTGVQRHDAQRFYKREGMTKTGFHYALDMSSD